MKKLFCVLLTLVLVFSSFSCGKRNRDYDEYEVKTAAENLIRKSKTLNDIYWGAGIGYYEDDNYANGYYYPADPTALFNLGFETVDELKERTAKVFSKQYCDVIFEGNFISEGEENQDIPKRYYQSFDCIMVYSKATVFLTDKVTYLYDTFEVVGSRKDTVFVTISVRVERGEASQERVIEIGLVEEDGEWRIDTPTYVSYRQE